MKNVLLIPLIISLGCSREAYEIRFIIPRTFTGYILVEEKERGGAPTQIDNGRILLMIPENGQLNIRGEAFHSWHKETAFFDDGQQIPAGDAKSTPELAVAFWSLPSGGNYSHWYLVGVRKEYSLAYERCATSNDPRPRKHK